MQYISLPDLSEDEILEILSSKSSEQEDKKTALQAAVRHHELSFSLPLLIEEMSKDNHEIVYPSFSLVGFAFMLSGYEADIAPFYSWADRFLEKFPSERERVNNVFEEIPFSSWRP